MFHHVRFIWWTSSTSPTCLGLHGVPWSPNNRRIMDQIQGLGLGMTGSVTKHAIDKHDKPTKFCNFNRICTARQNALMGTWMSWGCTSRLPPKARLIIKWPLLLRRCLVSIVHITTLAVTSWIFDAFPALLTLPRLSAYSALGSSPNYHVDISKLVVGCWFCFGRTKLRWPPIKRTHKIH